jgi:hypothetical protein
MLALSLTRHHSFAQGVVKVHSTVTYGATCSTRVSSDCELHMRMRYSVVFQGRQIHIMSAAPSCELLEVGWHGTRVVGLGDRLGGNCSDCCKPLVSRYRLLQDI